MRTHVTFRFPAEFVPVSQDDGILAVSGAQWFLELLHRIPQLQIDDDLCQEDWGVVAFAERNRKRFWIGLSPWNGDHVWIAHFHHGPFAWLQRLTSSGKHELQQLVCDFHRILNDTQVVSEVLWFEEREVYTRVRRGHSSPVED